VLGEGRAGIERAQEEDEFVIAAAPLEAIGAGITFQQVFTGFAGQPIIAVIPEQRVVAFAAGDAVIVGTAVQPVVSGTPQQEIAATIALDPVVPVSAGDLVVSPAPEIPSLPSRPETTSLAELPLRLSSPAVPETESGALAGTSRSSSPEDD
jgi:hypothetical protein